jgi:cytochrome c-type biogenesis protein CcsB
MTTADFAVISDRAIMSAGIVYALALLAHVVEWGSSLSRAGAPRSVQQPVQQSVHVGAGGATALHAAQPPATRGGSTGHEGRVDGDRALRTETAGRIGVALTVVAAALHLTGVVTRAFASDPVRVPWGNMYEFTLAGALGVTVIYLALLQRLRLRWMGLFVTAFEVVVLMAANLLLEQAAGPLVPALHSYWLAVHVGAAVLATGAFSVGALASTAYLLRGPLERRGGGPLLELLPSADALDRLAYRVHAVGFPLWTFAALVAGPIWAEYAWGSYWNWDPKEVWAFITWVVYAAYLHARATAGWRGKAAAIIALVAFTTLLFNFVGINFFFGATSQHSYAGN